MICYWLYWLNGKPSGRCIMQSYDSIFTVRRLKSFNDLTSRENSTAPFWNDSLYWLIVQEILKIISLFSCTELKNSKLLQYPVFVTDSVNTSFGPQLGDYARVKWGLTGINTVNFCQPTVFCVLKYSIMAKCCIEFFQRLWFSVFSRVLHTHGKLLLNLHSDILTDDVSKSNFTFVT